ncbi:MAG TPA: PAS domain S-box protein [Terriglobales bacterium]|jgi:two-component system cell cycle sensor histidine kinase/response regulator CckA|nr:PAS domain S-box protein [Terriglobales bacterium]
MTVPGVSKSVGTILFLIRSSVLVRLVLAALLSAASVWLSVALNGQVGPGVFPFLFPVCLVSAWFGGILSGILATFVLAIGAGYYHLPPPGWSISNLSDAIGLTAFVVSGILVSWVVDSLQRSHSLVHAVLTSIGDAVISTDSKHRVKFMNPQAEILTGWSANEAKDKLLVDVLKISSPGEADVDVQRLLTEAKYQRQPVAFPAQAFLTQKSGRPLAVDDSVAPIRLRNGKMDGYVIVFRDDTNRRLSQEALIEAEGRYREIFENAVVGMFQITPEGRYLRVNKAMAVMHGYDTPEQMVNDVSDLWRQEFTDPDQRRNFERLLNEHLAVLAFPLETLRRDGARLSVVVNARLVRDLQGNALYYEGTQEDIGERKRLQAQFEQAQRLEAVGRLAGGVAHDFNNILGVVSGYCTLIEEKLGANHPVANFITQIRVVSDRGAALIRQLLAFSRKQVVQPSVLDINQVVRESLPMLERLVGEDFSISLALVDEPGMVLADAGQLEQILMNLAVNARDAMPFGGSIGIETRKVEFDREYTKKYAAAPGPYIVLCFSDNGPGIDEATLPHIFEPFFTTKDPGKGTGLGLATIYGIVKQNSGNIWVYSEVGHGTTFKIYLPQTGAVAPSPKDRPAPSSVGGTEAILIVEDDVALLDVISTMLKSSGYRVHTASTEAAAIEIAMKHPGTLDLLVSDVVMKGTSGPELADKLRLLQPEMKVLYMSGYVGDKLSDYGPLEVLEKPFAKNELLGRVRAALDG